MSSLIAYFYDPVLEDPTEEVTTNDSEETTTEETSVPLLTDNPYKKNPLLEKIKSTNIIDELKLFDKNQLNNTPLPQKKTFKVNQLMNQTQKEIQAFRKKFAMIDDDKIDMDSVVDQMKKDIRELQRNVEFILSILEDLNHIKK